MTQTSPAPDRSAPRPAAQPTESTSLWKVVFASFIGTTIEWYDFFLYGTAAALVFNRLFFPNVDPLNGTLAAYATYAVGFAARPIGGVIFGHFGDRLGRKSMLVYSLLIMGVATCLIGFLPTYASIGIWAPVLLVTLRFAQGIGVGGEWGGAVLMAVEHSGGRRRGFHGSWPQMGVPAGLLLSTLVFYAFSSALSDEQFLAWGWRVPFLISFALVGVGLFIRLQVVETPAFVNSRAAGDEIRFPLWTVLRTQTRNILLGMGLRFAENGAFYILTVFVLSYGQQALGVSRNLMLLSVSLAAFIGLFTTPAFAALSDRVGRRPVYLFGAVFLLLFSFPFFWLLGTRSSLWIPVAIVLGVNLGHDAMYGPQAAYLSELYGTNVRYSGASFAYQATSVLSGAAAPLVSTALLAAYGASSVAAYMAAMAVVTVIAAWLAPETHRSNL